MLMKNINVFHQTTAVHHLVHKSAVADTIVTMSENSISSIALNGIVYEKTNLPHAH